MSIKPDCFYLKTIEFDFFGLILILFICFGLFMFVLLSDVINQSAKGNTRTNRHFRV